MLLCGKWPKCFSDENVPAKKKQSASKNRRQNVVNGVFTLARVGGLYVRAGGVDIQIWQKFH